MTTFYRQKQLEDILVLAKQFHETTEPVSDWLSVTEKKLANSEPIGTQTAKIQQQISRHKVRPVQEQDGGGWSQVLLQWLFPPQPEGVLAQTRIGGVIQAVLCAEKAASPDPPAWVNIKLMSLHLPADLTGKKTIPIHVVFF